MFVFVFYICIFVYICIIYMFINIKICICIYTLRPSVTWSGWLLECLGFEVKFRVLGQGLEFEASLSPCPDVRLAVSRGI